MKTTLIIIALLLPLTLLLAQESPPEPEYQLLSDIPGLEAVPTDGDFSEFINSIYFMSIGIASVLAVLMIVWVGFRYALSDVAGTKVELKEHLSKIIGGLVLLIGAYLLLDLINPQLTRYDNVSKNFIEIDFSEIEGFELPDLDLVIPDDPSKPLVYYVAVTPGGLLDEKFDSLESCEEKYPTLKCEKRVAENPRGGIRSSDSVAQAARAEWEKYGGKLEGAPDMCKRIQDYSQFIDGHRNWDCTASQGKGPWSAIFVSFVVRSAGKSYFPKATAHWQYIQAAFRGESGMIAHRFGSTYAPKPGDLVCNSRGGKRTTFETAQTKPFSSHCDIVVSNYKDIIYVVGGNTRNQSPRVGGNTVGLKTLGASGGIPAQTGSSIAILELP